MGLIKKTKQAYKNATIEKTDYGSPEPREPLSKNVVGWLNNKENSKKPILFVILSVLFIAGLIAMMIWATTKVYSSDNSSYDTSQNSSSSSSDLLSSTSDPRYYAYFNGISKWSFCSTNQKEFGNKVYEELMNLAMKKGSTVYCYSQVTKEGETNIVYMKESTDSRCFRMTVAADFSFSITEIRSSELPNASENAELEAETKAREQRKAEIEANDKSDKNDTTTTWIDTTNTSQAVLLTNKEELKKYLPEECVNYLPDSLINGMKETYGFNAVAGLSCLRQETVTQDGDNYTFIAQFTDQDRNGLIVEITFNKQTGNFSGKKVTN